MELLHQLGGLDQAGRIELELVRAVGGVAEDPFVVEEVARGIGAVEVRHPVGLDLEAGPAQESHRAAGGGGVMAAAIESEHLVVEALVADLDLGGASRRSRATSVSSSWSGRVSSERPTQRASAVSLRR